MDYRHNPPIEIQVVEVKRTFDTGPRAVSAGIHAAVNWINMRYSAGGEFEI